MYLLTPGLTALITYRHPEREDYTDDDHTTYRALIVQTNAKTKPNHAGSIDPYRTWKRKYMLGKMFTTMESLPEDEEKTGSEGTETDSMEGVE